MYFPTWGTRIPSNKSNPCASYANVDTHVRVVNVVVVEMSILCFAVAAVLVLQEVTNVTNQTDWNHALIALRTRKIQTTDDCCLIEPGSEMYGKKYGKTRGSAFFNKECGQLCTKNGEPISFPGSWSTTSVLIFINFKKQTF